MKPLIVIAALVDAALWGLAATTPESQGQLRAALVGAATAILVGIIGTIAATLAADRAHARASETQRQHLFAEQRQSTFASVLFATETILDSLYRQAGSTVSLDALKPFEQARFAAELLATDDLLTSIADLEKAVAKKEPTYDEVARARERFVESAKADLGRVDIALPASRETARK